MSRGNFYYAMGWVGDKTNGWTSGEIGRFDALEDGLVQSLGLFIIGALIQAFSAFMDVSLFASVLPLFSLILGIVGVIGMLQVSEKGILYVGGWTFISVLLFAYSIISVGEFLTDLIPIGILIAYAVANSGVLDGLWSSGYRDGSYL